ncbi:hypothetical protein PT2222_170164 [Paraburkholderia tropica]
MPALPVCCRACFSWLCLFLLRGDDLRVAGCCGLLVYSAIVQRERQKAARRRGPFASGELRHDVARARVLFQREHRHVLAVARTLHAAVRHFAHEREVRVDPRAAVLQFGGHLEGLVDVAGPDRTREAEVRIVGPVDRLLRAVETRDRHHRPEHFAAHDLVVLTRARHHGRLVEEAAAIGELAARRDLDVLLARRALDETRHASALALGNQRSHLHAFEMLLAVADRTHGARQIGNEAIVDFVFRVDAARGRAVLSRVVVTEGAQAGHHFVEIGVVEHDHGRFAAQFQVRALHRARRRFENALARRDITGDRNHAHLRLRDERRAHGVAASRHHVDDACRKNRRDQLGELERGKRRLLGRLEHDRVARRDGGRELPRGHHQRIVPRCDRGDHAQRIAADHARVARQIFARDRAVLRAARAREEAEHVGDRGDFVVERAEIRLAAIERFEPREFGGARLDGVGELEQQRGAILRRAARPRGPRAARGGGGRLHLFERRLGHERDHFARRRIENVFLAAVARHEFTADQQVRLHRFFHLLSLR